MAKKKAQNIGCFFETLLPARPDDILELDELWSFVEKKKNPQWIWVALCRRTRQIVSWSVGPRDWYRCYQLWQGMPQEYKGCHSFSDYWNSYREVFSNQTHKSVGKESGQTAHIERWNNTLRQRLGRFVRKTLSFSKTQHMHEICLKIFIYEYNLSLKSFES